MCFSTEPSEGSLEDFIPSYPGSPRDLSVIDLFENENLQLQNEAIESEAKQYRRDTLLKEQDFLIAAEAGDAERLQRLIKAGVNVHQTDLFGRNALHLTVYSANEAAILVALKAGIKATVKDDIGMTPLSICLMRSPKASIAELLFQYGAKILPRVSPMDTGIFIQFVMMCTPTEEEKKIFQLLVENGAVVDDPGAPGQRQALHFAAMSNNCEMIRILVDLGADLFALNHRHETPRDVAIIFKCKEAVECLTEIENELYPNNSLETEQSRHAITAKRASVIHKKEHVTDDLDELNKDHKRVPDNTEVNLSKISEQSYYDPGDMNKLVHFETIPTYEPAHSDSTASIKVTYDKKELTREMGNDSCTQAEHDPPGTSKNHKTTGNTEAKRNVEKANSNSTANTNEPANQNETASTNDSNDTIIPNNETEKPHNGIANARQKHSKRKDHSS